MFFISCTLQKLISHYIVRQILVLIEFYVNCVFLLPEPVRRIKFMSLYLQYSKDATSRAHREIYGGKKPSQTITQKVRSSVHLQIM